MIDLLKGFGSWHATGIDDFILVATMLLVARKKNNTSAVFTGQLVAVAGVVLLMNLVVVTIHWVGTIVEKPDWLWWNLPQSISGLIVLGIGIWILWQDSDDENEILDEAWYGIAKAAAFIYWANSTDDIGVMVGIMLPMKTSSLVWFSTGFLGGWMSAFVAANILVYLGLKAVSNVNFDRLNKWIAIGLIGYGIVLCLLSILVL